MSKGALNFNEQAVEYYTPKKLLDYFQSERYSIDYDPATTPERASYHGIPNFDTRETDGLKRDWSQYKRIWINPPFNLKKEFWHKAVKTYRQAHNDIFFLCPANFLTTKAFTQLEEPIILYIPKGRVAFEQLAEGGSPARSPAFGSVIVRLCGSQGVVFIPEEVLR